MTGYDGFEEGNCPDDTGDYWTDLKSKYRDVDFNKKNALAFKYVSELEYMPTCACEQCGIEVQAGDQYKVLIPERKTRFTSSIVLEMKCPNCDCPNTFELILYSSGRVVLEVRRYWEDMA